MCGTYIRQVIKLQNKIIYTVVNILASIFTENNQHITKINNMQTQYYCYTLIY